MTLPGATQSTAGPGRVRTTDVGRFLAQTEIRSLQLRAQRRNSTGFPFNRPHRTNSVGDTFVGGGSYPNGSLCQAAGFPAGRQFSFPVLAAPVANQAVKPRLG